MSSELVDTGAEQGTSSRRSSASKPLAPASPKTPSQKSQSFKSNNDIVSDSSISDNANPQNPSSTHIQSPNHPSTSPHNDQVKQLYLENDSFDNNSQTKRKNQKNHSSPSKPSAMPKIDQSEVNDIEDNIEMPATKKRKLFEDDNETKIHVANNQVFSQANDESSDFSKSETSITKSDNHMDTEMSKSEAALDEKSSILSSELSEPIEPQQETSQSDKQIESVRVDTEQKEDSSILLEHDKMDYYSAKHCSIAPLNVLRSKLIRPTKNIENMVKDEPKQTEKDMLEGIKGFRGNEVLNLLNAIVASSVSSASSSASELDIPEYITLMDKIIEVVEEKKLSEDQLEMIHSQIVLLSQHISNLNYIHQNRIDMLKSQVSEVLQKIRLRMLTTMTHATQECFEVLEDLKLFLVTQILADEEQVQLQLEKINNETISMLQSMSTLHATSANQPKSPPAGYNTEPKDSVSSNIEKLCS